MGKAIRFNVKPDYVSFSSTEWHILRREIVQVLSKGGLVVLPTETSYLLGADAASRRAVSRLMRIKRRPDNMPLSVAFHDWDTCRKWCLGHDAIDRLAAAVFPGPVTLILQKRSDRMLYASPRSSIGVRIPAFPHLLDVLKSFGGPITATSANIHGAPEPYEISECVREADLYWNAGRLSGCLPSTIADVSTSEMIIVREGAFPSERLRRLWNEAQV